MTFSPSLAVLLCDVTLCVYLVPSCKAPELFPSFFNVCSTLGFSCFLCTHTSEETPLRTLALLPAADAVTYYLTLASLIPCGWGRGTVLTQPQS